MKKYVPIRIKEDESKKAEFLRSVDGNRINSSSANSTILNFVMLKKSEDCSNENYLKKNILNV